jgi:hypothetical protein
MLNSSLQYYNHLQIQIITFKHLLIKNIMEYNKSPQTNEQDSFITKLCTIIRTAFKPILNEELPFGMQVELNFNKQFAPEKHIFEGKDQNALNHLDLYNKLKDLVPENRLSFFGHIKIISNRINDSSYNPNDMGDFEENIITLLINQTDNPKITEIHKILEEYFNNSHFAFDEMKKLSSIVKNNSNDEDRSTFHYTLFDSLTDNDNYIKLEEFIATAKNEKIDLSKLISIKATIYDVIHDDGGYCEPLDMELLLKVRTLLGDIIPDFMTEKDLYFTKLLLQNMQSYLINMKTANNVGVEDEIKHTKKIKDWDFFKQLIPNQEVEIGSFENPFWPKDGKRLVKDIQNPFIFCKA